MIRNYINLNQNAETEAPIPASIQNYANKAVEGLPKIEPTVKEEEPATPPETPAATETTTPAAEQTTTTPTYSDEDNKAFLEKLTNVKAPEFVEPTTPTTTPAATPTPEQPNPSVDAQLKEIMEHAAQYKKLTENNVFKALDEFVRSGKEDPLEFIATQIGQDPSRLSPVELKTLELKSFGIDGDELAAEIEEFQELSQAKQIQQTFTFKKQLESERQERLKALSSSYKPQNQIDNAEAERFQNVLKVANQELNTRITGMVDKKVDELHITDKMAKAIQAEIEQNPYPVKDEQGRIIGFNLEKATKAAIAVLYGDLQKKEYVDRAIAAGYHEVIKQRNMPSKEPTLGAPTVDADDQQKLDNATNQAYKKMNRL